MQNTVVSVNLFIWNLKIFLCLITVHSVKTYGWLKVSFTPQPLHPRRKNPLPQIWGCRTVPEQTWKLRRREIFLAPASNRTPIPRASSPYPVAIHAPWRLFTRKCYIYTSYVYKSIWYFFSELWQHKSPVHLNDVYTLHLMQKTVVTIDELILKCPRCFTGYNCSEWVLEIRLAMKSELWWTKEADTGLLREAIERNSPFHSPMSKQLALWSRVLCQMLTDVKLVPRFPAYCGIRSLIIV
jgi:hypothetical protein